MVCVDETNTLGTEWGSDDITLGGIAVDDSGKTTKFGPIKIGEFDDGTRIDFPNTPLCEFRVTTPFPRAVSVTFLLTEVDLGDLDEGLQTLLVKVGAYAAKEIAAYLGSLVGSPGGPVGIVVGVAVAYAIGKLVEYIKDLWENEVFTEFAIMILVPSATSPASETSWVATFLGPGEYKMRYRVVLSAPDSGPITRR
jgi:hypothetical protein